MRRGIVYFVIFLILLSAPTAYRRWQYYGFGGAPERAAPPQFDPTTITDVPVPEASDFVDEPEVRDGLILLDQSHGNNFTLDELGYLDGRLAARGYDLFPFADGDLAAALRPVDALVVIAPQETYTLAEVQAVSDFVARGGRLLLIGDPTRFGVEFGEDDFGFFTVDILTDKIPLNSLANEFDIIFNGDYLYNTIRNEGNFRNIIVSGNGLGNNVFTEALEQLAFYGTHSLQLGPNADPVVMGDSVTFSSATDRAGNLALGGMSEEGRVLALGDIHFLTEPYYTVYDNAQFIARTADFLTNQRERRYVLSDFPYFYESPVDLVYTGAPDLGPDGFDEVIRLQDAFKAVGQSLTLSGRVDEDHDALYLGIYNQVEDVIDILETANITLTIDPPLLTEAELAVSDGDEISEGDALAGSAEEGESTPSTRLIQSDFGNVQMSGTSLFLLHEEDGQQQVVVLAASGEGLESAVDRLLTLTSLSAEAVLADCLVQAALALCPTAVADEVVEAELITGGIADEASDGGGTDDGEVVEQGVVALGEVVTGELAENESHTWTFNEGPEVIDVFLEGGSDLDSVLELYDPSGELVDSVDASFTGGTEQLLGIDIPDDGDYGILVRDFFDDGGTYTLTVAIAGEIEPIEPPDDEVGLPESEDQGIIAVGDELEVTLDENVIHSWTFDSGPAVINILVQGSEGIDLILSVFGPDDTLIDSSDSGFAGDPEELIAVEIPDDSEYRILVADFFGEAGTYTIGVTNGGG